MNVWIPPMQDLPKTIKFELYNEAHFIAMFGVDTKVFAMLTEEMEQSIRKPKSLRVTDKLAATLMFLKIGVTFTALGAMFDGLHHSTISGKA